MRACAALALLAAGLLSCARAPERGPELARFTVVDPEGESLGTGILWQAPQGGLVEEVRARTPGGKHSIALDGELREGGYRARQRLLRAVDEVELTPDSGELAWKRVKGLAVERGSVAVEPGQMLLAESLIPGEAMSGSLALWWTFAQDLAREGFPEGQQTLPAVNVHLGRATRLFFSLRERRSVACAAGGCEAVRYFAWTRANGWMLWIDQTTGELLGVDNLFGRMKREGFAWPEEDAAKTAAETVAELVEEELETRTADVELSGTLSLPRNVAGPLPAVLLVHGSGAMDRDERPFMVFRDLAHGLAGAGVAVLRYDKRGVGRSRFLGEHKSLTLHDLTEDARAWLDLLASRPDLRRDCLVVVGHSEGGYIAPLLATREERVRGVVLLAGAADPLREIMVRQLELLLGAHGLTERELDQAARLQQAFFRRVEMQRAEEGSFEAWLASHFAHDPGATLRQLPVPLLALYGRGDLQVPVEQAARLTELAREANKRFDVEVLDGLDHLLMDDRGGLGGTGLLADRDRRLDPRIPKSVGAWVSRLCPAVAGN